MPRRSVEIEQDGARLILLDNDSGHRLYFIDAEFDASGRLPPVIADLERDQVE